MNIDANDLKFKHPFTLICAGPTGSGKTILIAKILEHHKIMFDPIPDKIIYCYSLWQESFLKMLESNPNIEFVEGMIPSVQIDSLKKNLIILDDLMEEKKDNEDLQNIFTKGSHHRNISLIFISQNLFIQGKKTRTISLNTHYMIIFKNPRDKAQFSQLARQMLPGKTQFLNECFMDATSHAHGYLFLDFKQQTPENLRVRTNIIPGEKFIVYIFKK